MQQSQIIGAIIGANHFDKITLTGTPVSLEAGSLPENEDGWCVLLVANGTDVEVASGWEADGNDTTNVPTVGKTYTEGNTIIGLWKQITFTGTGEVWAYRR